MEYEKQKVQMNAQGYNHVMNQIDKYDKCRKMAYEKRIYLRKWRPFDEYTHYIIFNAVKD